MVDQEMFCRLCLCQPQILIPVLDESGTESQDIVATVVRFLGLRLTIADRICVTCWASVDNFRKFCALVAERQTQFALPKEADEQPAEEAQPDSQRLECQPEEEQPEEQQSLKEQQPLEEQQLISAANQGSFTALPANELVPARVDVVSTLESATLDYEELTNKEQIAVQQLAYGQLLQARAYETQKSEVVAAEQQTGLVSNSCVKGTGNLAANSLCMKNNLQSTSEQNVDFAELPLQHVKDTSKQGEILAITAANQQIVDTTPKKQAASEQHFNAEKIDAIAIVEPTIVGSEAQQTAGTNDPEPKSGETVPATTRQLLRLSNARKLGRPRRSDANVSLEEDRLIASHMQLCCDICTVKIASFDALKRHFKTAHDVNGYVICCKKRLYKRGILIDHINVHRDPAYFTCTLCQNTFADRVCLRNHMMLKHNDAEKSPHQCIHCERKFAKLYFLQRHMIKHANDTSGTFRCEHCQKSYPNSTRLKAHIRNVHSDSGLKICNHCGELIRGGKCFERHLAQHESTAAVPSVECKVCGQRLSSNYCLSIHMERHEDKREYICALCGKDAPSRVAMNAHMRYYHASTETLHECSVCSRGFKTTRGLREHMTTHTGETLYNCNYCGKRFKCSSNLHAHRKWQHAAEWTRDKAAPKASL